MFMYQISSFSFPFLFYIFTLLCLRGWFAYSIYFVLRRWQQLLLLTDSRFCWNVNRTNQRRIPNDIRVEIRWKTVEGADKSISLSIYRGQFSENIEQTKWFNVSLTRNTHNWTSFDLTLKALNVCLNLFFTLLNIST